MSYSWFGGPSCNRSTRGLASAGGGGGTGLGGVGGVAASSGSAGGVGAGASSPQPDSAAPAHTQIVSASRRDRRTSHRIALHCGERARVQVFRTRERHWLREWAHADRRFYSVSLDSRAVGYACPQTHTSGDTHGQGTSAGAR